MTSNISAAVYSTQQPYVANFREQLVLLQSGILKKLLVFFYLLAHFHSKCQCALKLFLESGDIFLELSTCLHVFTSLAVS